jgi:hypothetical protein
LGQSAGVHALDIPLHTPRACWECQIAAPFGCFACLAGLAPRRRLGLCSLQHGENSEIDNREKSLEECSTGGSRDRQRNSAR